jgi:small-conductance mechanosensitive channel
MPGTGFLDRLFYGNFVRQWLIALVVLVVVFALLVVVRRLLVSRLGILAARTTNLADDLFVDVVRRTKNFFLFVVALVVASRVLLLRPAVDRGLQYLAILFGLVQLALWVNVAIGFWTSTYLDRRRAAADSASVSTINALGLAAKFAVWAILFITALRTVFRVDITALITGLGIGGIAIALAVQNILGDLLAALAIIFDKPFDVGDYIVVDATQGTVEHIGLKTTRIRSLTGEQIIVSNNELLKSRIRNFKRMYERRVVFTLDLTYDTPAELVERVPAIVKEAVTTKQPVRFERSHFVTFAESAFRVETVYWVLDPDYTKYMDIHQAINLELLRRFRSEGIEFAFPSRTVYVRGEAGDAATLSS